MYGDKSRLEEQPIYRFAIELRETNATDVRLEISIIRYLRLLATHQ